MLWWPLSHWNISCRASVLLHPISRRGGCEGFVSHNLAAVRRELLNPSRGSRRWRGARHVENGSEAAAAAHSAVEVEAAATLAAHGLLLPFLSFGAGRVFRVVEPVLHILQGSRDTRPGSANRRRQFFMPTVMTLSMASAVPTRSDKARMASSIIGISSDWR